MVGASEGTAARAASFSAMGFGGVTKWEPITASRLLLSHLAPTILFSSFSIACPRFCFLLCFAIWSLQSFRNNYISFFFFFFPFVTNVLQIGTSIILIPGVALYIGPDNFVKLLTSPYNLSLIWNSSRKLIYPLKIKNKKIS